MNNLNKHQEEEFQYVLHKKLQTPLLHRYFIRKKKKKYLNSEPAWFFKQLLQLAECLAFVPAEESLRSKILESIIYIT